MKRSLSLAVSLCDGARAAKRSSLMVEWFPDLDPLPLDVAPLLWKGGK